MTSLESFNKPDTQNIDLDKDYGNRVGLRVVVNGVKVNALCDSGADQSFTSEEFIHLIGVDYTEKQKQITGAFDEKQDTLGISEWKYQNFENDGILRVNVCKDLRHPLILGADFFKRNNLLLSWEMMGVVKHDKEFGLIPIQEVQVQVVCSSRKPSTKANGSLGVIPGPGRERVLSQEDEVSNPSNNVSNGANVSYGHKKKTSTQDSAKGKACNRVSNRTKTSTMAKVTAKSQECQRVDLNMCLAEEDHCELLAMQYEVKSNDKKVNANVSTYTADHYCDFDNKYEFWDLFDIPEDLEHRHQQTIKDLLWKYKDCISQHDYDIGVTKAITLEVNTPSDFFDRFKRQPQRRYSPEDQEIIDKWIQLNLHYGILSPSKSRIGSPVHVVKKMGKKHRPVCDFRELDKHIECPNLPYICIQDILERLGNAKIFTVVDLTQSFYSIEVKPSDREKLAIQTHRGLYHFNRTPMGLKHSPLILQQLSNMITEGERNILNYVDDIVVFSSNIDDHIVHLNTLFSRLRDFNLKIKPTKTQICRRRLQLLGHIISENGLEIPEEKVKAIRNLTDPKNYKQAQSTLGTMQWVGKYLVDIGDLKQPLLEAMKKEKYELTPEIKEAMCKFKERVTTAPVVAIPDDNKLKVLQTDASTKAIGGVLCQQKDPNSQELQLIESFTKTLSPTQQRWPTIDRELFAIVHACRKYYRYLITKPFVIYTDHKPLLAITKTRGIRSKRLESWAIELNEFRFRIFYVKGIDNQMSDALSRVEHSHENQSQGEEVTSRQLTNQITGEVECCYIDEDSDSEENEQESEAEVIPEEVPESQNSQYFDTQELRDNLLGSQSSSEVTEETIREYQLNDKYCNELKRVLETKNSKFQTVNRRFILIDGVVYRKKKKWRQLINSYQVVIPSKLIHRVIKYYHGQGHHGYAKTEQAIAEKLWFVNMRDAIRAYVKTCSCNRNKHANTKILGLPQTFKSVEQPFETIHIDYLSGFNTSTTRNKSIIVCVCRLTRYMICKATPDMTSRSALTFLENDVFNVFNIPKEIVSDNGTHFTSSEFEEALKGYGIKHNYTPVFSPNYNGLVERCNAKILQGLRNYTDHHNKSWDKFLGIVAKQWNRSVNSTTGFTPFFLLFGYSPANLFERKLGIDILEKSVTEEQEEKLSVESARQIAVENIRKAEEKWNNWRKSSSPSPFKVKDLVWAQDMTIEPGHYTKLRPLKIGPYIIVHQLGINTYVIIKVKKFQRLLKNTRIFSDLKSRDLKRVHCRMLFPYCGRTPRRYDEMCSHIDNNIFKVNEREEVLESDLFDIKDYDKYMQWTEKDIQVRRADRLRTQTTQSQINEHNNSGEHYRLTPDLSFASDNCNADEAQTTGFFPESRSTEESHESQNTRREQQQSTGHVLQSTSDNQRTDNTSLVTPITFPSDYAIGPESQDYQDIYQDEIGEDLNDIFNEETDRSEESAGDSDGIDSDSSSESLLGFIGDKAITRNSKEKRTRNRPKFYSPKF